MFEAAAILDEVTSPRFNPPAIVEQLRVLPFAVVAEQFVSEVENDFIRVREVRSEAQASLASMIADDEFKDDGEEFHVIIASFERQADDIGKKLASLEKALRVAQKRHPERNKALDERLLAVARQDFEDRIDVSVFWRALQAKIWPSPLSENFDNADDFGKALRAAIA